MGISGEGMKTTYVGKKVDIYSYIVAQVLPFMVSHDSHVGQPLHKISVCFPLNVHYHLIDEINAPTKGIIYDREVISSLNPPE